MVQQQRGRGGVGLSVAVEGRGDGPPARRWLVGTAGSTHSGSSCTLCTRYHSDTDAPHSLLRLAPPGAG